MKKILALMLCFMMTLTVAACSKDDEKASGDGAMAVESQSEEKAEEKAEEKTEEKTEENKDEGDVPDSAEVLAEIVDEFNNTDDPEVKEQLRQRLEEIFAQAEAVAKEQE